MTFDVLKNRGMTYLVDLLLFVLAAELLNIEETLQVAQSVIDLHLRNLGFDSGFATQNIALMIDQN